jgi:hypothetical protein
MKISTCPHCKRRDDMHTDSGETICLNPPCIYARALAKSQATFQRLFRPRGQPDASEAGQSLGAADR